LDPVVVAVVRGLEWRSKQAKRAGRRVVKTGVVYVQRTGLAVVVQSGLERSSLSMEAGPVVGKGCQGRWSRSKMRAGM
jgi:hypothetical protein